MAKYWYAIPVKAPRCCWSNCRVSFTALALWVIVGFAHHSVTLFFWQVLQQKSRSFSEHLPGVTPVQRLAGGMSQQGQVGHLFSLATGCFATSGARKRPGAFTCDELLAATEWLNGDQHGLPLGAMTPKPSSMSQLARVLQG